MLKNSRRKKQLLFPFTLLNPIYVETVKKVGRIRYAIRQVAIVGWRALPDLLNLVNNKKYGFQNSLGLVSLSLACLYPTTAVAKSEFSLPPMITNEAKPTTQPIVDANSEPNPLNQSALKLTLTASKTSYKMGEFMTFTLQSNQDCYLTVVDFGTSGSANLLFPNKAQPDNHLLAGKTLAIPNQQFDLKVGGKAGNENIWASCRKQKTPLFNKPYDFQQHFFISLGKASTIRAFPAIAEQYDQQQEARQQLSIPISH